MLLTWPHSVEGTQVGRELHERPAMEQMRELLPLPIPHPGL